MNRLYRISALALAAALCQLARHDAAREPASHDEGVHLVDIDVLEIAVLHTHGAPSFSLYTSGRASPGPKYAHIAPRSQFTEKPSPRARYHTTIVFFACLPSCELRSYTRKDSADECIS